MLLKTHLSPFLKMTSNNVSKTIRNSTELKPSTLAPPVVSLMHLCNMLLRCTGSMYLAPGSLSLHYTVFYCTDLYSVSIDKKTNKQTHKSLTLFFLPIKLFIKQFKYQMYFNIHNYAKLKLS